MRRLITPEAMRAGEKSYFTSSGVPSIEVMERAARALAGAISEELPAGSAIYFACGAGGNGGDGTACARLLCDRYRCIILQPRPPKSPDAIENLRRARECGVPVMDDPALFDAGAGPLPLFRRQRCLDGCLPRPDAWVDALFGTGLSRCPEGAEAKLIEQINIDRKGGARIYAADIPSGLNGATGEAYDACVWADRSVTFQYLKTGMTLAGGLDVCGEIIVADVGFPEDTFGPPEAVLLEPADIGLSLPQRLRNIHKGDCGHLLVVAGSFGMAGAAALCAKAALRSGAGLVSIACPRSIVPILQTLVPQAMCVPLEERDGAISAEALPTLEAALAGKSAAVIGPGLSRRADSGIVRLVLESGLPAVIDADGLNLLAENRELLGLLAPHHVLTPHPGEAARLIRAGFEVSPRDSIGANVAASEEFLTRTREETLTPSAKAQASTTESLTRVREEALIPGAKARATITESLACAREEALMPSAKAQASTTESLTRVREETLIPGIKARDTAAESPACAGSPMACARMLSSGLGATVLYKGAASVIASPSSPLLQISASGCCGMARGGSGDILTGILGALLADRRHAPEPILAAACASEIHGLAGELAQRKYGAHAMNAADILEFLPEVFRTYVD